MPVSSSVVERKKKRRGRGERADPLAPSLGAREPKLRKRRVRRQESHESGTYSLLLWI
jgi:hypothetical protein